MAAPYGSSGGTNYTIAGLLALLAGGVATIVVTTFTATTIKIVEQAAPALSASGQATMYADSTAHNLQVSQNGGAYAAIGSGGGGTPGGSTTQVQYNNAGAFGGITGATTNGTTLTLVGPVLGTPASGVLTNCTGTASGLTAGTVTTNANLTGDVTSSGNATTIANDAVTTAKILNANVTAAKMVNAGVFTGDVTTTFPAVTIGNDAITTVKILNANVTAAKMVNAGVFTGDATTTFPAVTIGTGKITDTKASLAVKPACMAVSTTNLTLSGEQTIDGQLSATSMVLLSGQTAPAENGPWVTAAGAWARPTWYPAAGTTQAFQFITVFIRLGTLYQGSTWRMTTAGAITIDTTGTTWTATPFALGALTASGTLDVPHGGSGAATLTGILKGNGASAFTAVTAPSGALVGDTDTQTFTNKRITVRVVTAADATSVTPNSDSADITYQLNTQATGTLTINADGGTPTNGQKWIFKIKATNVQTYSWNAVFVGGTDIALPTVSTAAKVDNIGFIYDSVGSKWECTSIARGY